MDTRTGCTQWNGRRTAGCWHRALPTTHCESGAALMLVMPMQKMLRKQMHVQLMVAVMVKVQGPG